jgi:hypothetical protein
MIDPFVKATARAMQLFRHLCRSSSHEGGTPLLLTWCCMRMPCAGSCGCTLVTIKHFCYTEDSRHLGTASVAFITWSGSGCSPRLVNTCCPVGGDHCKWRTEKSCVPQTTSSSAHNAPCRATPTDHNNTKRTPHTKNPPQGSTGHNPGSPLITYRHPHHVQK